MAEVKIGRGVANRINFLRFIKKRKTTEFTEDPESTTS